MSKRPLTERILSLEGRNEQLETFGPYIDKLSLGDFNLSFSSIRAFSHSPLHFLKYKTKSTEQTDAMKFGSLLHLLILQPHKFFNKYVILCKAKGFESNSWTKKENVQMKEAIYNQASKENKTVVTMDHVEKALILKDAILSNDIAGELIRNCSAYEKMIQFEWNGFEWKGFIDGLAQNYIIDLKKVPDANPAKLRWKIKDDLWSLQAFLYLTGSKLGTGDNKFYYNICYDDKGNISIIRIDWMDLQLAQAKLIDLCVKFSDCIISEDWAYSYEFNTEQGYYKSSEL